MAQRQADVVETVDQAVLAEGLHLERSSVPSGLTTTWRGRSIRQLVAGKAAASSNRRRATCASGSTDRQQAVLEAVVEEDVGELGAISARKPYWSSAQGACSRLEPQPKFLRASSMTRR